MKSKKKTKAIFLNTLVIFLVFSTTITYSINFFSDYSDPYSEIKSEENFIKKYPQISSISEKIHIDNNWTAAKTAGICTGNGTYSEPYVIEDYVINGEDSASCILIENSNVFFRIENCTVFNASYYEDPYKGIMLSNVSNGNIFKNKCFDNSGGIFLNNGHNNTIIGNNASGNCNSGIELRSSQNNTVSGNYAEDNDLGISLYYSYYNNVTKNNLKYNGAGISIDQFNYKNFIIENNASLNYYGIALWDSGNNSILRNALNDNYGGIVVFDNCNNNSISRNFIKNNSYSGIELFRSNSNTILENIIIDNTRGIYLAGCDENTLSGNLMSDCGLVLSEYNTFTSLIIDSTNLVNEKPLYFYVEELNLGPSNFTNAGQVFLFNCNESLILSLNISKCYTGITLYNCHSNNISGNIANINWRGIYLIECNNNFLTGNTANNNTGRGIHLFECDKNILSGNTAINNTGSGLYLIECNNNSLSGNTANKNTGSGIHLNECDDNTILGNSFDNNDQNGIFLWSSNFNTITENIVNYNKLTGIVLDISYGNIVYLNCFVNPINAYDNGQNNQWDYKRKGNYWNDYTGSDTDADGIGDVRYIIAGSAGNQDNFPLMRYPYSVPDVEGIPIELIILISIIGIAAVISAVKLLLIERKRKTL